MYRLAGRQQKLQGLGINTIGNYFSIGMFNKESWQGGAELYSHAHGIDNSPVAPKSDDDMNPRPI